MKLGCITNWLVFWCEVFLIQIRCLDVSKDPRIHSVKAIIGENITLPCNFTIGDNRECLMITWTKEGSKCFVHRIKNNEPQQVKDPHYINRTEVFPKISQSILQASLILRKMSFLDEGIYRCSYSTLYEQESVKINLSGIDSGTNVDPLSKPSGENRSLSEDHHGTPTYVWNTTATIITCAIGIPAFCVILLVSCMVYRAKAKAASQRIQTTQRTEEMERLDSEESSHNEMNTYMLKKIKIEE